jgi:hypothetical protein
MFIRNTRTSSSINENSEIFIKFKNFKKIQNFQKISKISKFSTNFKILKLYTVYEYFIIPKNIRLIVEWSPQNDKDQKNHAQ